ncbi:MAG: hypothetical protein Q9205_004052 [Flavoplaca limonia]
MTSSGNVATQLSVVLLGTCDTKLQELLYLRSRILSHAEDASITLIDVGNSPISDPAISISHNELVGGYGSSRSMDPSTLHRSDIAQTMTECATACLKHLLSNNSIHGVISVGGSSGTSLTSTAMRHALPFLIPKLIVSTMASGDTASFVREKDITLMYSIVDIAGSNTILNGVLDNAAGGIVGMARAYQKRQSDDSISTSSAEANLEKKTRIGITMFGVTTPGVESIRKHLNSPSYNNEIYVFHATGHGGLAMERLISSSHLDAIIDLTLSEITDYMLGGIMSAGPHRLEAGLKAGIPYIISVGACEMVNFGPRHTLPRKFEEDGGRKIYEHNEAVTLVRTTVQESRWIGECIASKIQNCALRPEMVQVVLPTVGLSALSVKGGVFEDVEADEALFEAIERGFEGTRVCVVRVEGNVNDEGFVGEVVRRLIRLVERRDG